MPITGLNERTVAYSGLFDGVTELLDARIPMSSRNPELDELTGKKPRIVLLNKCDVADDNVTREWIE